MTPAEARRVLEQAEMVCSAAEVDAALDRMALAIRPHLEEVTPVLLCVMMGGLMVTGELARRLGIALEIAYVHATRYRGATIGSTVVVLLVFKRQWLCLWAGDSRAYLLRDGVLQRITKDHSVAQELVDMGKLGAEELEGHPYANHITRAVGANHELVLDERGSELRDGDAILLCSDGLNKELSESEITAILGNYDCNEATRELIDLSLEHGGRDNVTVALVRFEETTGLSEPAADDTAVNYQILQNNLGASERSISMQKERLFAPVLLTRCSR